MPFSAYKTVSSVLKEFQVTYIESKSRTRSIWNCLEWGSMAVW
jgi:hypothetical protein